MAVWDVAEQSMGYREYLFHMLEGESKIRIYGKDFFEGKLALSRKCFRSGEIKPL